MDSLVVVAEPERQRIGRAASLGDQPRLQRRTGRNHPRRLAARRRRIGREHHFDFGVAGDRPRRARQGAAEQVEPLGHQPEVPTTLSGRSLPNTRW